MLTQPHKIKQKTQTNTGGIRAISVIKITKN